MVPNFLRTKFGDSLLCTFLIHPKPLLSRTPPPPAHYEGGWVVQTPEKKVCEMSPISGPFGKNFFPWTVVLTWGGWVGRGWPGPPAVPWHLPGTMKATAIPRTGHMTRGVAAHIACSNAAPSQRTCHSWIPSVPQASLFALLTADARLTLGHCLLPRLDPQGLQYTAPSRSPAPPDGADGPRPPRAFAIELVHARGVPLPGLGTLVRSRCVRMCLRHRKTVPWAPVAGSNVHTVAARWSQETEDVWAFDGDDVANPFIVRTDLRPSADLKLYIEFDMVTQRNPLRHNQSFELDTVCHAPRDPSPVWAPLPVEGAACAAPLLHMDRRCCSVDFSLLKSLLVDCLQSLVFERRTGARCDGVCALCWSALQRTCRSAIFGIFEERWGGGG